MNFTAKCFSVAGCRVPVPPQQSSGIIFCGRAALPLLGMSRENDQLRDGDNPPTVGLILSGDASHE